MSQYPDYALDQVIQSRAAILPQGYELVDGQVQPRHMTGQHCDCDECLEDALACKKCGGPLTCPDSWVCQACWALGAARIMAQP